MIVFHKAFQLALNLLSNLNIIHENSKTGITIACIIQCIINFLLFVHTKVMVVLVLTMLQVLKRQKKSILQRLHIDAYTVANWSPPPWTLITDLARVSLAGWRLKLNFHRTRVYMLADCSLPIISLLSFITPHNSIINF